MPARPESQHTLGTRSNQASPNFSTARMMPRSSARPFSRPISEQPGLIFFLPMSSASRWPWSGRIGMRQVGTAFFAAARLLLHQSQDDMSHVGATLEMLGFVERAVLLDGDVAQMDEMDAVGEFLDHGDDVVIGACPVGAGAERQPIGRTVDGVEDGNARPARSRRCVAGHRARRARRQRGSSCAPLLFGHRNDLAQEPGEVAAQFLRPDRIVVRQGLAKTIPVIATLGRRQAGDQVALDPVDGLAAQLLSRASASAMRAAL